MTRATAHYLHEHPEVTLHNHHRLDRIERHLRTLIALALAVFPHRIGAEEAERFRAEAEEEIAPLSYQWLDDLLAFSQWDAEAADDAELRSRRG